uniref:Lipase domain-containing protein n=1 Tax=Megaselia scalaris TaxID=36166 RepID=T1GDZ4_MEGSC
MGNMKSPYMKLFAPILGEPGTIPDSLTSFEFLPNNQPMEILAKSLCNERSKFMSFCAYSLFLIGGFNELNLNASLIPEIAKVAPAGSSFRQILHYFQEHLSGKFREWDYGPKKNKEVYGKEEPPEYPVDKIKAPTHFYYSKNDFMSSDVDVEKLAKKMKKEYVRELYLIPDHKFTHLDYLYGLNSKKVVYDRIRDNIVTCGDNKVTNLHP